MSEAVSPAERYADHRRFRDHPQLKDFAAQYPFGLDDFQVRACREVEAGVGVLVAAPTGSGKTVVGEFAVHLALATGRKCFYTTPIKALSNQKFADLVERHGAENVGLLTGDNSVNGEAPVVVMTTEVLRNMLYAGSRTLTGLGFVVMDEVHYLADRMRGAVWEEVIIHLPESVQVISLSATVSNAEEFGEWLAEVRGATATVVEERRPVPLFQHVMVGRRLLDLFASSDVDAAAGFVKEGAPVNDELLRIARDDWASSRLMRDRRSPRKGRPGSSKNPRSVGNGRRVWIPSRTQMVERLDREGLLPAICFIFSRVGCDAAVRQCLDANVRLTTHEEREEIYAFVEAACRHLPSDDLDVLGYHDYLDGLTRGVAAHHAGMLPVFKECVEELFRRGLVRVVFATETLALGINMPARTVVIEKLSKWNGETHADITPGEYTQLTGRAGRRGLDVEGHAVVLWQPGMNPREVAGLAATRTYPLRSSFRPSYNMAVNLVHHFGRERSRELLESSFAQFQADRAVVGLARQLRKAEDALDGYREAMTCDRGDFMAYAALRRRISDEEKQAARGRRQDRRDEALESLRGLRRGDVIDVPAGKAKGYAVVIDPGLDGDLPRPYVVTADRQARRLSQTDFPAPVTALTRVKVPKSFNGRNAQSRRDVASALRDKTHGLAPMPPSRRGSTSAPGGVADPALAAVEALREQLRAHPCHDCPDREEHARWGERWFKLQRDTATLKRRVESRTNTIARQFDRVCDVLLTLGYLEEVPVPPAEAETLSVAADVDDGADGDDGASAVVRPDFRVTGRGRHLTRIYTDMDLVAAECLRRDTWAGLSAPELASVLSVLVYESRRADDSSSPRMPSGRVREVIGETVRVWGELEDLEKSHRLELLGDPDLGFAWIAYRWAKGDDLDVVLADTDLAAGDFVRWIRQLLDLADQVADAAGDTPLRRTARDCARLLRRGVIDYAPPELLD